MNKSPWRKVEGYENYKSHSEFVFKPNFQTDILTDLNSDSKPIHCFFTLFIDEIQDILIIYINHYAQNICDALRDLVPYVQFKKREKHPWRNVKCYLNCTNGTKSRNASQMCK